MAEHILPSHVDPLFSSKRSSLRFASSAFSVPSLHIRRVAQPTRTLTGFGCSVPSVISTNRSRVLRAIYDAEDNQQVASDSDDDEEEEDKLVIENLPLESKLVQKLEHKMKMKFGKNVRLRRKKLVRKRRMSKKGRGSPSKINKLKNV